MHIDIRGAWRLTKRNSHDIFIMGNFIDKGYPMDVLAVLNDVRVYTKAVVLSDMITKQGTMMSKWAIMGDTNRNHKWVWSPRRLPTTQI